MKYFVASFLCLALVSDLADAACNAMFNKGVCLHKSDPTISGFKSFFQGGDPCFKYKDNVDYPTWCFYGAGQLAPCDGSNPDCGYSGKLGPAPPTCDKTFAPCAAGASQDNAYCADDFVIRGNKHTMCDMCGVDMKKCNAVCSRGITEQTDIDIIVKTHNELRSRVAQGQEARGIGGGQASASDMYELVWDTELASIAQTWADQCTRGHDVNRVTSEFKAFPFVGQNAATSWNSQNFADRNLADKVKHWYSEVDYFPSVAKPKYSMTGVPAGKAIGHYTQVVWGSTTKIGCGFIAYKDTEKPNTPYRQNLICNYGEGGNANSGFLYTAGASGSKCPKGSTNGLCKQ